MRILIGAPVRQSSGVFRAYLDGLRHLEIPDGVTVQHHFILHNSPQLAGMLEEFGATYALYQTEGGEYAGHQWTPTLVGHVAYMRNCLMELAVAGGYDFLLMPDSDLVLHPKTLRSLLAAQKDIVAEVFWTRWKPKEPEGPNAWDYDAYTFKPDSLEAWRKPGLYRVGMAGACLLMSQRACDELDYCPVPNLTMAGEDRHFGVRAACAGYEIWLDTHYPAIHLYRADEMGA
jgi:hypothetical protein